jgi:hypothetical protein
MAKINKNKKVETKWLGEFPNKVKKTWKNQKNNNTIVNANSKISSVSLSQKEEGAVWTNSSSSRATPQGWNLVWPIIAIF